MPIKEYLLSTDNFENPRVLSGSRAVGTLLIRLLILVPGINPRHPDMGCGIGTLYRFISQPDLHKLEARIEDQIATYMPPEFQMVVVKLEITSDKYLIVHIQIHDVDFVYDTRDTDYSVQVSDVVA